MIAAYIATVCASLLYGISPILVKLVLQTGMTSGWVAVFRFYLTALFAFLYLFLWVHPLRVTKKQALHLGVFGFAGFGMTIFLLSCSYQFLPVSMSMLFHFTYPIFVNIAMVIIFREKGSWLQLAATLIAIGGMVAVTKFNVGLNVTGVLLAAASGIAYSCYVIANKKSAISEVYPVTAAFYISLISGTGFLAEALITEPPPVVTFGGVLLLIVIALFCTLLTLLLLIFGIRKLGAVKVSVINMFEPIMSIILGAICFQEPMTFLTVIGCVLILGASLLIVFEPHIKKHVCSLREKEADPS